MLNGGILDEVLDDLLGLVRACDEVDVLDGFHGAAQAAGDVDTCGQVRSAQVLDGLNGRSERNVVQV